MTAVLLSDTERPTYDIMREEPEADVWDVFVERSPNARYTHLAAWRTVMNDALGHETVHLVARERDGSWAGVLPMVWVRSPITGKYLVSMPFLNSGGPIGTTAAREALALAAAEVARRGGADLLELRTRESCTSLTTSSRKLTVVLPLPETVGALWRDFPSKLRSQIKKPKSAGFTTRFGPDERHAFHDIYTRHMRDLGSPALGMRVFDALSLKFGDLVDFGVVYDQAGNPVAGGCGFAWRNEFELVWASALRATKSGAPNMLLYWSFMERCVVRGLKTFDFGRCSAGSGTHRFKLQWGGVDIGLPWAQWSASGVGEPPTTKRPHYAAAAAIWRLLPPVVTRAWGPSLARLIP